MFVNLDLITLMIQLYIRFKMIFKFNKFVLYIIGDHDC